MSKEEDLEKELLKYKRRNKLLTKRNVKLQSEIESLVKELDILESLSVDQLTGKSTDLEMCPQCNSELETTPAYSGKYIYVCANYPTCKYRIVK